MTDNARSQVRGISPEVVDSLMQVITNFGFWVTEYRRLTKGRFLIDDWDTKARLDVMEESGELTEAADVVFRQLVNSLHTPSREGGSSDHLTERFTDEVEEVVKELGYLKGEPEEDEDEPWYTKCGLCHLFVERNTSEGPGIAEWVHLHRGDDHDEALDETHNAQPSEECHTLDWWRENGPFEMKARFALADAEKAQSTTASAPK